jgi:glycerol-3-phosphate dehydrogenase
MSDSLPRPQEFSWRTRAQALERMGAETFDFLIIGGGITGASVARDAAARGYSVALVEKNDFGWGTSSRSSKLIHGGLRYLENFEWKLVFEALSERALLLRNSPHLVRPLPFYLPVYAGDPHGKNVLSLGLWLYDLLALFRTPGFHRRLSRMRFLSEIPFMKPQGLVGGFRYFDASMWDDVLVTETLRSAQDWGALCANYLEALTPLRDRSGECEGFELIDRESARKFQLRAHRTILCGGPWTDLLGERLQPTWKSWLAPSQGVHLVFSLKRLPVPGALVMSHPEDGRISFVIPRPDLGAGVTIVGTTDGPSPQNPEKIEVAPADEDYLFRLLDQYFPSLKLTPADLVSAYIGVRPLMRPPSDTSLQKVSREHYIEQIEPRVTCVAGGKYTTSRTMGAEIVDVAIQHWSDAPTRHRRASTREPINARMTFDALDLVRKKFKGMNDVPFKLIERYGAEVEQLLELFDHSADQCSLEGFPYLEAQLRFAVKYGMAMHLEDFYFRRVPLHLARVDGGRPWASQLAEVLADARGVPESLKAEFCRAELARLDQEIARRDSWRARKRSA